ncbi:MAG: ribosome-associated ATPase/putative transporter RbbA [Phycisphaerales bacterium JB059]
MSTHTPTGDAQSPPTLVASLDAVSHRYVDANALDNVTLAIPGGRMAGLIGPDGVGKSTLLALIAGVRRVQSGRVSVLGADLSDPRRRRVSHGRLSYMPQGLGRNLYPTLSVAENLDFIARLFGIPAPLRRERIDGLLASTGLAPFHARPAGKLSGGMKQKLSLCGALLHDPELLILDEPTTGVDPLSRRQFWELLANLRAQRPELSVVVATAYMEEAEQFDWLGAMNAGRVIATGAPAEIKAHAGASNLEDAFFALLPEGARRPPGADVTPPRGPQPGPPAIEAEGLTKRFGRFVAVDRVSFRIARGEIFGFLGSNGCGKSTTMKMLTGLLPASEGSATLLGRPIVARNTAARHRVGYMSQSFSLYGELTVRQNLELHARLFHIPQESRAARVQEMLDRFGLRSVAGSLPAGLPLGMRQRLQLAVAVQHRPEVLILDEPTSGVDPVARDEFWAYLIDLSRNEGVTIFISTHFMNEAARCDRISLMHAGRVLAVGAPEDLARSRRVESLEDAFISYLKEATADTTQARRADPQRYPMRPQTEPTRHRTFSLGRLWAYARRESTEIRRDRVRLAFAVLGPLILMLTFGYGISFDVEHLKFAVLDQDRTPESRQLIASLDGSRYFERQADITTPDEIDARLKSGELTVAMEIPPEYGKDLRRGRPTQVGVWLDGAMPFRAETTRGYLSGLSLSYIAERARARTGHATPALPVDIEPRFRYNQAFKSIYAIVPSVIMLSLVLIPSIMTALGVVREKETGSIAHFRSSPVTRFEFLVGKQLPYVGVGLVSFLTMTVLSLFLFGVPIRGSVPVLLLGVLLYVLATTGFGLVVSTLTRTQVAAVFATAVIAMIPSVNFSGLLVPVSSLSGSGRALGLAFPSAWFQQISIGAFTKGLGIERLWPNLTMLAVFGAVFITAATLLLKKQEA